MRVLYYSRALVLPDGGGSHARGLRDAFGRLGHDVLAIPAGLVVASQVAATSRTMPGVLKLAGREIRAHIRHRRASDVVAQVRQFNPDVAVMRRGSYDLTCNALVRALRCPIVAEVNAVFAVEGPAWGEQVPSWEAARERAYLLAASRVCCISREVADDVAAMGVDTGRTTLVENGVDEALFSPLTPLDAEVAAWGSTHSLIVGYTGSIGSLHDVQTLVRAAETVLDIHGNAGFVWVGMTDQQLRQIGSERVSAASLCLGPVTHQRVPGILLASDVCWGAFNYGYGSPLKVYEYAALGKPVAVAADGMPARVVEDSRGGVVVPQGDAAALGSAVAAMLSDDERRASLGAAGLAWVSAGHRWVDVASAMLEGMVK